MVNLPNANGKFTGAITKVTTKDTKTKITERKNGDVPAEQEASHSSMHSSSSSSQNSSQETKPEEVTLAEEEQAIYEFGKQTLFKAKPPLKTAKLKGECAELAEHVKTLAQFQSLLQFVRALPYIQGQIHLKNLVNALNGWLESLEARPTSRTKPRGPVIAQVPTLSEQEEIDRKNQESIARWKAKVAARKQAQQEGATA